MKMLPKEASRLVDKVQVTSSRAVCGKSGLLSAPSSVVHFAVKPVSPK